MPLSEHEQRMLDEMERNFMQGDADVVSASRQPGSLSYRNIIYGSLLVLLGLLGLLAGVATTPVVAILGFVVMLVGVILAVRPTRRDDAAQPEPAARPQRSPQRASFMDRMNDRWDRRRDRG